jgi:DNA processing protein
MSVYGRAVTQKIAAELAQQGVVIISGLAYGVDICAHQAALNAGGQTIAVLPSSIEHIYPSSHAQIAKKMVEQGGALVTEYGSTAQVFQSNFIARNRIVAALSQVILVTEGALKSGTLHTARFALEQGIDVMAVPGNVTNITSEGTNNLLKSGAGVATCAGDVLNMLGLKPVDRKAVPKSSDPAEQALIHVLAAGTCDGAQLQQQSGLDVQKYNQALTMLEITGVVVALGGDMWQLA